MIDGLRRAEGKTIRVAASLRDADASLSETRVQLARKLFSDARLREGRYKIAGPIKKFRMCIERSRFSRGHSFSWAIFLAVFLGIGGHPLYHLLADEFPRELVEFQAYEQNPVFTASGPTEWDARIRERGWILRDESGYRMWYTGYDGSKQGTRKLGLATSRDGLQWKRHSRNPLLDDLWVEDMMVVRHDGRYYMFAEGFRDQAHLLESTDGLKWKPMWRIDVRKTDGQPIEPGPYGTPTVWVEGNQWYLYYERRDEGVWLATSTDRRVWTNVTDTPVLARGPDKYDQYAVALNQIVKHKGRYYGYYHASDTPQWLEWSTCVAVSDDLVQWRKFAHNPILRDNKSSGILVGAEKGLRLYTMHDRVQVHLPVLLRNP